MNSSSGSISAFSMQRKTEAPNLGGGCLENIVHHFFRQLWLFFGGKVDGN